MKRKQLTLFIDFEVSINIELIRKLYNPLQFELIKSHVTLCRENEIIDLETIKQNIKNLQIEGLTILFNKPIFSENDKGVLLQAIKPSTTFNQLRNAVLKNTVFASHLLEPHVTLMHPRNSQCSAIIFEQILTYELPSIITFNKISLIEQQDGGIWECLETHTLFEK